MRAALAAPLTVVIWIALAAAPLLLDDWSAGQLAQHITFGIFALSLAYIWGKGGILCFGQAIFFGLGAYAMALVTLGKVPALGTSQLVGLGVAIVIPAMVAGIAGLLIFHGRGLSGAHFAIVTLCAAVLVETMVRRSAYLGGFNGLFGIPAPAAPWRSGFDATLSVTETYYLVLAAALAAFLVLLAATRTAWGTGLAGIRENEPRMRFFGYDVRLVKTVAFALSAAVAGLAGALFTAQFGFVSPPLVGFALSTEVLIWTAVGGRHALMAAFLGAILVRSVENALSETLGQYWLLALGFLFIATVVFAPQGVFGRLLQLPPPRRLRGDLSPGRSSAHFVSRARDASVRQR